MASKNIVSVLQEERTFPPAAEFTAQARVKPEDLERMGREAAADPSGFLGSARPPGDRLAYALHGDAG